jgi:hypothetical protein
MGSGSNSHANERVSPTVFYALQHLPELSIGSLRSNEKRVANSAPVISSPAEHFRAKAAECLDRLVVPDRQYQRLYCELVAQWLILAREADSKQNQ